jgi:hypothetical protein
MDEQGRVNFSQGLDSVPERYRSGAQFVNTPAAPPTVAPLIPSGRATGAAVAGGGQIRFTPGQAILVNARINDTGSVKLLLDTGASVTTINPRLLAQLGVSSRDAVRGSIRGVTGSADTLFVMVNSIDVNGAKAGPIRVVAHDVELGQADGLLGPRFPRPLPGGHRQPGRHRHADSAVAGRVRPRSPVRLQSKWTTRTLSTFRGRRFP